MEQAGGADPAPTASGGAGDHRTDAARARWPDSHDLNGAVLAETRPQAGLLCPIGAAPLAELPAEAELRR